MFVIH